MGFTQMCSSAPVRATTEPASFNTRPLGDRLPGGCALPAQSRVKTAPPVSMAPFLESCPDMVTLGIRPSMADYAPGELDLLRRSRQIFFPTIRYAGLLKAAGLPIFPSASTYRIRRSRLLQCLLASMLDVPQPRFHVAYGHRQKREALADFAFPFQAMGHMTHAGTEFVIRDMGQYEKVAALLNPLILREIVSWERRAALIWINGRCAGALEEQEAASSLPESLFSLNRRIVEEAHLDDILIEWGFAHGRWQLTKMRHPPIRWPSASGGVHHYGYICDLIRSDKL